MTNEKQKFRAVKRTYDFLGLHISLQQPSVLLSPSARCYCSSKYAYSGALLATAMRADVPRFCQLPSSIREMVTACQAFVPPITFGRVHDTGDLHQRTRTRKCDDTHPGDSVALRILPKVKIVGATVVGDGGLQESSVPPVKIGCKENSACESLPMHVDGPANTQRHVEPRSIHMSHGNHRVCTVSLTGGAFASADVLKAVAADGAANWDGVGRAESHVHARRTRVARGEPQIETQQEFVKRVSKLGKRRRGKEVSEAIRVARARGSPRFNLIMCNTCITALGRCGLWRAALALLDEMRQTAAEWKARNGSSDCDSADEKPILPDVFSYSAAITVCANAGMRRQALELLSTMRAEGVPPNVVSYNAAAHACVEDKQKRNKSRRMARNHAPCNGEAQVDAGQGEHGKKGWSLVLGLMSEMRAEGVNPDSFTFSTAITACGNAGQWKRAILLLDEMEVGLEHLQPDLVCVNAAIAACARVGQSAPALRLLDRMINEKAKIERAGVSSPVDGPSRFSRETRGVARGGSKRPRTRESAKSWPLPDAVSFNAAIEACATEEYWRTGAQLLTRMRDEGIRPDVRSYAAALSCLRAGKQWNRALAVLDEMSRNGGNLSPDLGCYGTVISTLGEAGQWERALALLRRLEVNRAKSTAPSGTHKVLRMGEDPGQLEAHACDNMVASSSPASGPNLVCYNAVLAACARGGAWFPATSLLVEMEDRGMFDVVSFNSAIHACRKQAQWRKAIELLDRMCNGDVAFGSGRSGLFRGARPDVTGGLDGSGKTHARRRRVPAPDVYSFTSAITACAAAGKEDLARGLLRGMPAAGVPQTVAAFNAAIGSIGRRSQCHGKERNEAKESTRDSGDNDKSDAATSSDTVTSVPEGRQASERARDMLSEMRAAGLVPDVQSYNQVLAACQRVVAWQCALDVLGEMKCGILDGGIVETPVPRPDIVSYNTAMGACGRAGRWEEALSLLEEMPTHGLVPDAVSYNTACAACANVEQWQIAFDILELGRRASVLPVYIKLSSSSSGDIHHDSERDMEVNSAAISVASFHSIVAAMARQQRLAATGDTSDHAPG